MGDIVYILIHTLCHWDVKTIFMHGKHKELMKDKMKSRDDYGRRITRFIVSLFRLFHSLYFELFNSKERLLFT